MSDDDLILRGDALAALSLGETMKTLQRRIEALPAITPQVKPLVWEDFEGQGAKASAFYQANYMIQYWRSKEKLEVSLSYPGYGSEYDGPRWLPTLEVAKAAAQADYNARILAAIDMQPAPDTAKLVEAANWAKSALPKNPMDEAETERMLEFCTVIAEWEAAQK